MAYKFIDLERLNANCSGDDTMKKELLTMGIDTISKSINNIRKSLNNQDWHTLAKTLHQLRPVLSYCGVINYISGIEKIEQDIINNQYCNPDGDIQNLQSYLNDTIIEINNLLNEI
jgi:HPt (histidine-containing phosphotransfer) domain-containing protein